MTVTRGGQQPYLTDIRWSRAPAGQTPPEVAVVDTGIDGTHPSLRQRVDVAGSRSFAEGSPNPFEDHDGHGTHVAGIIAGQAVGSSVHGVSSARLLIVKVADSSGSATTSALVRGIRYAAARGARVINVSFGGGGYSAPEQEAIADAVARGALVVVAGGNSGRTVREFPGAYRHVLSVAAVDDSGQPLPTSTGGSQIALAAPGANLLSTLPGGYGTLSGSSMAAAVVSGVAARVWAARPSLKASQVRAILVASARDVGPVGPDPGTGAGMVDLAHALTLPTPPADSPEPNDDPRQAARRRPGLWNSGAAEATLRGTVGSWDDPRDMYRVTLTQGESLTATLTGPSGTDMDLRLWRPGTPGYRPGARFARTWLAGTSIGPGADETLSFTAVSAGVYDIDVTGVRGSGAYTLRLRRTAAGILPAPATPASRPRTRP